MDFYQSLYQRIFPRLKELIEKAKDSSIKQYIFVGHSLGGAMACIAAFDSIQEKLIAKAPGSPVLITFGQPRVGNYAFANELMKSVPIIYRIVNRFDAVSALPACAIDKQTKNCKNEFGKEEIDAGFTDYKIPPKSLLNRLLNKANFFPWHFGKLIYNKAENQSLVCSESEPKHNSNCKLETSTDIDYHLNYFGYVIPNLVEPKVFSYNLDITNNTRGNSNSDEIEKSGRIVISGAKESVQANKAPAPFVLKDQPKKGNTIASWLGSTLMNILKGLNLINKRK